MARSTGAADKAEDTGVDPIPFNIPTKVEQCKSGVREMRQAPAAEIGPAEAPREYKGERLRPSKGWNANRPLAKGGKRG